jgi:hypothetical protein
MHNKNIYNKNWKIPAARQQFSVRGIISFTAQPRSLEGTLPASEFVCPDFGSPSVTDNPHFISRSSVEVKDTALKQVLTASFRIRPPRHATPTVTVAYLIMHYVTRETPLSEALLSRRPLVELQVSFSYLPQLVGTFSLKLNISSRHTRRVTSWKSLLILSSDVGLGFIRGVVSSVFATDILSPKLSS